MYSIKYETDFYLVKFTSLGYCLKETTKPQEAKKFSTPNQALAEIRRVTRARKLAGFAPLRFNIVEAATGVENRNLSSASDGGCKTQNQEKESV